MYNRAVTVAVATLLLLAPLAGVAGATIGAGASVSNVQTTATASSAPSDQTYSTGHENVSLWERAVLPLRADLSDASTVIENQNLWFDGPGEGDDGPANRHQLGVFDTGVIPLELSSASGADTSHFADEEATVIVGHVESASGLSELEMTTSFGEEELAALNEDVNFTEVENTSLDSNGNLSTEYDTTESGQYVAIVATVDDDGLGLTAENGDIDPASEATIIGLERFLVQDGASDGGAPDEFEPGENVTFTPETSLEGDDITHGVVLYDYGAFQNTQTVINVTAEPDSEFSADDVVIEHDLVGLNGVLTSGNEPDRERREGELSIATIRDAMNSTFGDGLETNETGETVIDGSVTVLDTDDASTELTVETLGNWSDDADYRWVHVATDETGAFETSTDTIAVEDGDDGNNGGGGGFPSPGPSPDPDYRLSDASVSDVKIAPGDSVDVSAKLQNVGEGTGPYTAELRVDGEVVDTQYVRVSPGQKDTVTFTHTFDATGEYEVAINDEVAGTVSVSDAKATSFDVSDATLSETEIGAGDSVDVSATVTNTGDESGTFTAELRVDGTVVAEDDVTLSDGESTTVEFTHTFDATGEYEIAVNDADAGTLTVTESDDDGDSIPGFGILAAVAALASGLIALRFVPERD